MSNYNEKADETGKALARAYEIDRHGDKDLFQAYYTGWCSRGGWDKSNPKTDPALLESFLAAARKVLRRNCTEAEHHEADQLLHKLEGRA